MSVPYSNDDVLRTYTSWAPWYDLTHAPIPLRRAARKLLGARPGERVLDVACGTGINFGPLRKRVGPTGEVVGVDLTPAMLDRARRRIDRHGWTNVRAIEADASRLPFEAASFDAAICTFALTVIPDYQRAVREVARVLRPRGRFAVLEVASGPHGRTARWGHRWPRLGQTCAVDFAHDVNGALQAAFGSVSTQTRWNGAFTIYLARWTPGATEPASARRE